MKNILFIAVLLGLSVFVSAQGIVFEHSGWKEVLAKARKEKKMVFVDFYTSWCGPCKEMSKNVMTQSRAGELFNRHFVNFKQDAEKGEGPVLAKRYEVTAYPTFIFVNHRGELIYKFLGRRELDEFVGEGERALKTFESLPLMSKMGKEYRKGRRDTAFLREYYDLLKGRGEGENVLNDYLKALPEEVLLRSSYLPEVSLYDEGLYSRLMEGWKRLTSVKDKKASAALESALMKALGGCLERSIAENREDHLEALLALKKELGDPDSPLSQMMGGGIAYSATPHIRLDFYAKNKLDGKFRELLCSYMAETMDTIILQEKALQEGFQQLADSARQNPKKLEDVKRMKMFITTLNSLRYKVLTVAVLRYVGHYWDIVPVKDERIRSECEDWVLFVSGLAPSLASGGAEVLIKLGARERAIALLEQSLEKLRADENADPAEIRKMEEMVESEKRAKEE